MHVDPSSLFLPFLSLSLYFSFLALSLFLFFHFYFFFGRGLFLAAPLCVHVCQTNENKSEHLLKYILQCTAVIY